MSIVFGPDGMPIVHNTKPSIADDSDSEEPPPPPCKLLIFSNPLFFIISFILTMFSANDTSVRESTSEVKNYFYILSIFEFFRSQNKKSFVCCQAPPPPAPDSSDDDSLPEVDIAEDIKSQISPES